MRKLLLWLALATPLAAQPVLDLPLSGDLVDRGRYHLKTEAHNVEATTDRHGKARAATHFGQNSWIGLTPVGKLNHLEEFTLSAWIQPQQHREHNTVISKVTPSRDFNLQLNVEGRLVAHINSGVYEFAYSERHLPLNQWTHVAATFGHHTWKLYINGKLDSTHPVQQIPLWHGQFLTVGNLYPDGSEGFLGNLDDVRVYPKALTPGEIQALAE